MTEQGNSISGSTSITQIGLDILEFLEKQIKLLDEATRIDECLDGCAPDGSPQREQRAERATRLREEADRNLRERLRQHTTRTPSPRFEAVALLAAAFAQGAVGGVDEDEIQTFAVSQILERTVSHSKFKPLRDPIEDLLNLAHRRAALVREPARRFHAAPDRSARTDAGHMTHRPGDDNMFGFPRL